MTLPCGPLACSIALALLVGCAGPKPYPEGLAPKNLSLRTAVTGARAELDIHSVDAQCRTAYAGTVRLDKPAVAIALPADRWSYLVFEFASGGFLGPRGKMSKTTLIRPRPDRQYEIEVTYRDDIYNVMLREGSRELPLLGIDACTPS